jgi:hypothetical protein
VLSQPDLQFRLIDSFGDPAFCDPMVYPVERAEDPAVSARKVADLRAQHPAEFDAIVRHDHLAAKRLSPSDDIDILLRADELEQVPLIPLGAVYAFTYKAERVDTVYVTGMIDRGGTIRVSARAPAPKPFCPTCLARSVRIATPTGDLPVTEVHPGTLVWTRNAGGQRVAAPVLTVGHTPAPTGHRVVHLVLADGRSVDVSPGHPLPDGRAVGELRAGDPLDGSFVASAELHPYRGADTWDLLPAGATHVYWANGVPLRSTLA